MGLAELIGEPRCGAAHSVKQYPPGEWIKGELDEWVLLVQGNGAVKNRMRCTICYRTSSDVPNITIIDWLRSGLLQGFPAETIERQRNNYPECVVMDCVSDGMEFHHFAPRNTFGVDCDRWPVLPLCRTHHVEWHQRMDGYRWMSRGAA